MPNPERQPSREQDAEYGARHEALKSVVSEYLSVDDAAFLDEMDDEGDRLGYVYGRLLEQGEDPEVVLEQAGVTESTNEI